MSKTQAPTDHYSALGVTPQASMDEIKRAFRVKARESHPDVAGSAPETVARFKRIKQAYDVLSDAGERARYDRRRLRRKDRAPRMPGGFYFWGQGEPDGPSGEERVRNDPSNDLDLEDIFGDHGGFVDFGFGGGKAKAGKGNARPNKGGFGAETAAPGRDISMTVDVPADVAERGGTVTLNYMRHRRTDDGRGTFRYDEIYDLRVPPGTPHGATLRCQKFGHAGSGGGPYGDLICDVRVVGRPAPARPTPSRAKHPKPAPGRPQERSAAPGPGAGATEPRVVPITIQEALMGGRVELETPQGAVVLNLPPCTSGGARFRLRGKGESGPTGIPGDLVVQLRVVAPPMLDDESYALMERFAALNPYNPRGSR